MPKNQLTDMKFDEVSLVDRGANQYAKTVISKRDSNDTEENVEPEIYDEDGVLVDPSDLQVGDVIVDEDGNERELTEDDFAEPVEKSTAGKVLDYGVFPGAGSAADAKDGKKLRAGARTYGHAAAGSIAGYGAGAGIGAGIGALTRKPGAGQLGAAIGGSVGSLGGSLAGVRSGRKANAKRGNFKNESVGKSYAEEIREELSKALGDTERDEIIAKALGSVEEYREIAKAAEQAAFEERELRLEAEYVEVAKSYAVGVEPEVLGPVLKRCAEALSPEDQEVLAHALSVGTEAIEKFFEESGTYGGGSNSDVLNSVDAYLDENVAKSDEDRNAHIVKMFEKNPDLYTEYDAERQHAIRYGY